MNARLPAVPADIDDPVLNPIFDRFRDAGHPVPLLYRTLGNAPAMLRAWTDMAWPLRHAATTDRGLRELMIMRVALLTGAAFEWAAHWPAALQHGVSETQLDSLGRWADASCFSETERAVLACVDEVIVDGGASETSFATLADQFDPGECVELVLTAAFYACVSRTLTSLGIEPHATVGEAIEVFNRQRS